MAYVAEKNSPLCMCIGEGIIFLKVSHLFNSGVCCVFKIVKINTSRKDIHTQITIYANITEVQNHSKTISGLISGMTGHYLHYLQLD